MKAPITTLLFLCLHGQSLYYSSAQNLRGSDAVESEPSGMPPPGEVIEPDLDFGLELTLLSTNAIPLAEGYVVEAPSVAEDEQDEEHDTDKLRRDLAPALFIKNKATGLVLTDPGPSSVVFGAEGNEKNNNQKWIQTNSALFQNPWYGPFYFQNVGTGSNLEVKDIGGWSWELFYVNNGIVIRHWLTTDVINMDSSGVTYMETYVSGKTSQLWSFR